MNNLQDLATELLKRGVYCVLNANIPRDVGRTFDRRLGVDVQLACIKRCGKRRINSPGSKVAVMLGRALEDKRRALLDYGFDLIQVTQDALDHNFNGLVDMVEEKVLGVSKVELLWLIFDGYTIPRITEKTGLTKRQIQVRMRRWFGCTIPELRQRKHSAQFQNPVLEVCTSERDVRVPERVFV
jgi:hypothetical protein